MSHNKLFELLNNDVELTALLNSLEIGFDENPFIIDGVLKMLEDDNPFYDIITDGNKKALLKMLKMHTELCIDAYFGDIKKIKDIIKMGKIDVYKLNAADGFRDATEKEVEQGVKGLIREYIYPAGEQEFKYLSLILWTFYGYGYYYRSAGYELEYTEDGKIATSLYEMIHTASLDIKKAMEWFGGEKREKAVNKLKKYKRNKGYKYASYASDEVVEDITVKQLLCNIKRIFPRKSENKNYRKALALSIKGTGGIKLSPYEISWLREVYDKYALDSSMKGLTHDKEQDTDLKEKCELILKERHNGKIDKTHFVYVIIPTLKRMNYTKCSAKQYKFIEDAYNLITSTQEVESRAEDFEVIAESDIDISLQNLSNAIGDGLFDDIDD